MQLLFLIYSDWPGISVTPSQDIWNTVWTAACEWAAGLCYPLCRVELGERQARAMMSPSLANKLGLTLWGPWRKGKGMEWECAVAVLQDNIHGRWEAMVMLGEAGGGASWNLCKGEGQMTPATGIAVKEDQDLIQTAASNWVDTPIFTSDPREKNNTFVGPCLVSSRWLFSMQNRRKWKEVGVVIFLEKIFFFLDSISLKAVPSFFLIKGQSLIWIFINSSFCRPLCLNALIKHKVFFS